MRLVSLTFLALLLPAFAAVYSILPRRGRLFALFIHSLAFYFLAAGKAAFFLPLLSLPVALAARSPLDRRVSAAGIALLFALCKGIGFLPLGLSFFVLRAIGFLLSEKDEKRPGAVMTYLLFFPTVTMGPLWRYTDFEAGLSAARDDRKIADAVCRLSLGLFKKFFFADRLLAAYHDFSAHGTALGSAATLFCFALYLYFDFSGYSDIAVGVGGIFGFSLPENFDYPYMSRSVGEFFRRWHITLGRWLLTYVYLPLGGSRNGARRTLLSLLAVWVCTAFWHGTTLCYFLWGAYFFLLVAAEKLLLPKGFKGLRLPTFCLVSLGWVFFFSPNLTSAFDFFKRLFCLGGTLLYDRADFYDFARFAPFLLLSALAATPIFRDLARAVQRRFGRLPFRAASLVLFVFSLSYAAAGGYSPFLYASY